VQDGRESALAGNAQVTKDPFAHRVLLDPSRAALSLYGDVMIVPFVPVITYLIVGNQAT
jgi:hypothetical protein